MKRDTTADICKLPIDKATLPASQSIEIVQVADLIVAYLESIGIDYVFGIPGGAIEPLYNALARSSRRGGPRPILARHETGAAFMAEGYMRETGKIGVCCATSGPGATNLITGVACAYDNNIPMLVITGQPSLHLFGRRAFQESACTGIDIIGMFRHCTRYNSLVSHAEQIESKLLTAIQRAVESPRGPVHLSVPLDILRSPSPVASPSYDLSAKIRPRFLIDMVATGHLRQLLEDARNPRLVIGSSCGEAIAAILRVATERSIPFATTPDGKGLVNPYHPLFRGVFGFAGHASAYKMLLDDSVDLILAVGISMSEWTSSGWNKAVLNEKLVHIDDSAELLAYSHMARLHVRGRILSIFEQLADPSRETVVEDRTPTGNPKDLLAAPAKFESDATPITPQRLMHDLGQLFPPGTRFLADPGNSLAWTTHYLHTESDGGGWLRLTMDFAPMGWAIGGAVGTAVANRDVPVVCITGDGSMLMNGQEISVAVAEGLTVIFVVLNDQALGMVKHGQRLAGAERIGFQLPATDFAAMARALGADGYTVHSPADMATLDIAAMCGKKGPSLIDVHIDCEEVPPMNLRIEVLGTST